MTEPLVTDMTALNSNGDMALHPTFFIERVRCDKGLARHLQLYQEMRLNGWDLVVLLDLRDRRSVIALGIREFQEHP
jgi:hypothetical protein